MKLERDLRSAISVATHVYDLLCSTFADTSRRKHWNFYGEVMHRSPHEHFVFLLGSPKYLSRTWPDEVTGR